jgi:putative DNA methylase
MEPEVLIKAGVIRKGRAKRGRTHEVKLPVERYKGPDQIVYKQIKEFRSALAFP